MSEAELEQSVDAANAGAPAGPPPLRPFGLVLRHDGRWSHEGEPIRNRRLRERFDRAVVYRPEERAYVVQIRRFRGLIEIEEAGFFVRSIDLDRGCVLLSDGSREALDVGSLRLSPIDGALLCRVRRDGVADGLPARFTHAAHAELFAAIEPTAAGAALRSSGRLVALPAPLAEAAAD